MTVNADQEEGWDMPVSRMNDSWASRNEAATECPPSANDLWNLAISKAVSCASTGQSEPTTDPAPAIRNAEVRPRIPTPVRAPTEESHEDRTTRLFGCIL